jgi:hypothetical protein
MSLGKRVQLMALRKFSEENRKRIDSRAKQEIQANLEYYKRVINF